MIASTARVATERPSAHLKQLCEHFADASQRHSAQEFDVTFDDQEGFIDFAPVVVATCRLHARQEGVLAVEVSAGDQAALERVQRIVTKHLERLGALTVVEWRPGTEASSTG
jgi:hypothetical protein